MQPAEIKEFNDDTLEKLLKLNRVLYPKEIKLFVEKTKHYSELSESIRTIENRTDDWIHHLDALIKWCKNELYKQIGNAHDNNEQLIKRIMVLHQQTVRDINISWEHREQLFKESEKRDKEHRDEIKFLREMMEKDKKNKEEIIQEIVSLKYSQSQSKGSKKKGDEEYPV